MTKNDLSEKIQRRLGAPMVKVELSEAQIYDNIDYTLQKFKKWAIGQGVQEHYFTLMLSAGVSEYDCPVGVTEVVEYETHAAGTIHTLFTMENYLYNQGMYDQLLMRGASTGYTMVSYHIARDFLEAVKRYVVDSYNYKYHPYDNKLEIYPTPKVGSGSLVIDGIAYDTPGFILVRSYKVEGDDEDIYGNDWVLDYATALCKITLGNIRRKFANFNTIGNTGISLDGDALISDGREELEKLETRLMENEVWEGGYIIRG